MNTTTADDKQSLLSGAFLPGYWRRKIYKL